jgi:outer membrane lipoprotein-sorting protein
MTMSFFSVRDLMEGRVIKNLFIAVFAVLISLSVSAQTADEMIRKHIEAYGGLKNIKSIRTMKVTGTFRAQGKEAPFIHLKKRPNKMRQEILINGLPGIKAYDGQIAWVLESFMGKKNPEKMTVDQSKVVGQGADFDGHLVDHKEKGSTVEYAGKEDIEGIECHKLKITKSGRVGYVFLDVDSYLIVKSSEMGMDMYQGDYKQVNGLNLPHSLEYKYMGASFQQFIIEKYELNIDLDDSLFRMPAASKE